MFPGVGPKHETTLATAGPAPGTETWLRMVEDIRGTLPEDVWKVMSPEFYLTFWSLSYGDIFVPSDRCALLLPPPSMPEDSSGAASRGCGMHPEVW